MFKIFQQFKIAKNRTKKKLLPGNIVNCGFFPGGGDWRNPCALRITLTGIINIRNSYNKEMDIKGDARQRKN